MDSLVEVEVEFPYTAEQPDELTIKVGDIIKNVVMEDGGWWEGELNGKKGMFPDNFVKVRKNPEKETAKKDEGKKKDVQATKRQSVKDLANKLKLGQVGHDGPPLMKRKDINTKKKRAKVVFSYEPEQDDELKLEIGDMVDVLKQEEEGWWEGIVNGKQGMFPSNFVEIIEEGESTETAVENTEDRLIKGKKVQGVGLGNIFNDGPIKLRKTDKSMGNSQEPPKAEKREEPAIRKPKDTKPVEKAVVRYSYVGEHEDELSLNEGEVINVLDKELEDSGWWRGEVNGHVGVFPDNFVELIKEEPSDKASRPMVTPAPQPKPKKPPPPAQPAMSKPGPPKLPDKGPVISTDHSKPEPEKEEKPAPSQPAVPSKKPIFPPPPLTKKPTKTIDLKETENKDEAKHGFEAIEPTSDKLVHLTAMRPRGPTKRPPSQDEEGNGEVKESQDKPALTKTDKPDMVGGKTAAVSRPAEPPVTAVTAHLQLAIDDLRKELVDLKANTVSKTAFNELRSENEQLKQELENVKTQYSRRFRDIMAEVDEEKKIRLSTQVEMERIRKLVAESHV